MLAWPVTKVKSKEAVTEKGQKEGRTVHFATLMDLRYLKNSALGQHFRKYKERAALRGGVVRGDSGSYAVFMEHGSSAA